MLYIKSSFPSGRPNGGKESIALLDECNFKYSIDIPSMSAIFLRCSPYAIAVLVPAHTHQ